MKTSCLCSISVCHTIQLKLKSDFLQNFTTHSSCRTSGYYVTAMKVTERYKKNMLHWKNSFLCKGNENKSLKYFVKYRKFRFCDCYAGVTMGLTGH